MQRWGRGESPPCTAQCLAMHPLQDPVLCPPPPNLPPLAPVVPRPGCHHPVLGHLVWELATRCQGSRVPSSAEGCGFPGKPWGASDFQGDLSRCPWEGEHSLFTAKMPSICFLLPFSTTKRLFPTPHPATEMPHAFFSWQPFENKQKMSKQR